MKSVNRQSLAALLSLAVVATGCSKATEIASSQTCATATQGATSQSNPNSSTIPLYLADPATTGSVGYPNEPLVSVTVCSPNHSSDAQCQTINNVLLDTGSVGLRIFKSVLNSNVALAPQNLTDGVHSYALAECVIFGSGADWGSVQKGDVVLGNQTAANIPIHVIDIGFSSIPNTCAQYLPDTDPCSAQFNGILGVGLFAQDCGADCTSTDDTVNWGTYFACDSTGCFDAYHCSSYSDGICVYPVPLAQQVANPVSAFSGGSNNNGISITLPSVNLWGQSQVQGSVTLGVGSVAGVTVYPADGNGNFNTTFNGSTYGPKGPLDSKGNAKTMSFLDSGSNALFIPAASGLAACSKDNPFLCSSQNVTSLTAMIKGAAGNPSVNISFDVTSTDLLSNAYTAFPGLAALGTLGGTPVFDWGLPFFFNRTVYVVIENKSVTGTTTSGPFWAF